MGLGLYASLARLLLQQGVAEAGKHFAPCGVARCTKHSVGCTCADCGRFACIEHVYIPVSLPVRFLCTECIASRGVRPRRKKSG